MKVQLEKTLAVPASADTAWALLQDIEAVATCMPARRSPSALDAQHYKGTVAVKFGPASMAFRGTVELLAVEPASRTLRLAAKGTDTTGGSGASMDLTARIEALDARLVPAGRQQRGVDERQGRRVRRPHDELGGRAGAAAVRHQLRGAGAGDAAASAGPRTAAAPPQLDGPALAWAAFKEWLRSLFAVRKDMSAERALGAGRVAAATGRRGLHRRALAGGRAAADAGPRAARCCSKATPASARPRWPRCWPRCAARG